MAYEAKKEIPPRQFQSNAISVVSASIASISRTAIPFYPLSAHHGSGKDPPVEPLLLQSTGTSYRLFLWCTGTVHRLLNGRPLRVLAISCAGLIRLSRQEEEVS